MIIHVDRVLLTSAESNRLAGRFCRFDTVKQTRVKRRPFVNENNAAAILALDALNPHASSRQMKKNSRIS